MPTRVRQEVMGIKGDECDCGRRSSIIHCNQCGSTRVYARSGRLHTHLDGSVGYVDIQFRCQTCGHLFISEERKFCDAPPVSAALAKLKIARLAYAQQQGEFLRPKEAEIAQSLTDLLGQPLESMKQKQSITDYSEVKVEPSEPIQEPDGFVIPNGLTREEYNVADRAFRLEWATTKLNGQAPTQTVEEYVERRLKGELF